jgi:competence protein ComEC
MWAATAWSRFRRLPGWAQVGAWLALWPILLALLVMSGPRIGVARPVSAGGLLLAGLLVVAMLISSLSEPPDLVIEDALAAPADAAGADADERTEPEPPPEPDVAGPAEADPDDAETAEPEPADEPEVETTSSVVDGELEVHFLDVGQGDATLLQHADATILVDTGRHQASDVLPSLQAAGVDDLDLVVITHPHADHIGQFDQVLGAITVSEVWWSGSTTTSQTFGRALAALERSDAAYEEPRAGDTALIGPLEVEVVNPPAGVALGDLHDANLALRVTFGEVRFLFTGDAEASTEARMVSRWVGSLAADILQLGHHGSNTSTTSGFLDAVDPTVAIYSASAGNQYGHPHAEVLDRLGSAGVDVYGTAVHGTVTVTTDGRDWTISTQRSGTAPTAGDRASSSGAGSEGRSSARSSGGSGPAPSPSPTPSPSAAPPASSACEPGQVDINRAGADELQRIIHIGPDRAEQLPGLRPFRSVQAMDRISGIGPARLQEIIAQGVACAG